jgi:hypothetical protein
VEFISSCPSGTRRVTEGHNKEGDGAQTREKDGKERFIRRIDKNTEAGLES